MKTRKNKLIFFILSLFVFLIYFSCTTIKYKEVPPKDVAELNCFPDALIGDYISADAKDFTGKKITAAELECRQKSPPAFQIFSKKVSIYEDRTKEFPKHKKDSLISRINDSLIFLWENEKEVAHKYYECNGNYHVLLHKNYTTLNITTDSVKLKTYKGYYFLSMGSATKMWTTIIFKPVGSDKIKVLRRPDEKEELTESKLKKITPVNSVSTDGYTDYIVNPDTTALMKIITGNIFTKSILFVRKK